MSSSKNSPKPGDAWFDVMDELEGDSYTLLLLGIEPSIMGVDYDSFPRFWSVLRTSKSGRLMKLRYPGTDIARWYNDETGGLIAMYRIV